MSDEITIARATLTELKNNEGETGDRAIQVQFNPVSLQLSISNSLEEGKKGDTKQYITKSSAKLSFDLIFDTTSDSSDVRAQTSVIAALMAPENAGKKKNSPPVVSFEWGTFSFRGLIESYKETLDFFAPEGVPLRATLNLTLARQEAVFSPDEGNKNTKAQQVEPSLMPDDDVQDVANNAGSSRAARAIAAANGLESLRFPSGAITLDATVALAPPVAFATGGASLSAGAGFGMGAGIGLGMGAGAGFGVGGSAAAGFGVGGSAAAGFGVGGSAAAGFSLTSGASLTMSGASTSASLKFGSRASAGVTSSAGAFAGLRVSSSSRTKTYTLDTSGLVTYSESTRYVTDDRDASFTITGQARLESSTGLSASAQAGIEFEE